MDFNEIKTVFEKEGYKVSIFETAAAAAEYLNGKIDGATVAFGGSVTLKQMNLGNMLETHNTMYNHWTPAEGRTAEETLRLAATSEVYVSSVNAISKTGEIVNIDGSGNRVSSLAFGHKRIYYVAGRNKISENLAEAMNRARNIAAPINAKRLGRRTPCAADGKCHNCSSPDRICNGVFINLRPMRGVDTEIVFVNEDLGF